MLGRRVTACYVSRLNSFQFPVSGNQLRGRTDLSSLFLNGKLETTSKKEI